MIRDYRFLGDFGTMTLRSSVGAGTTVTVRLPRLSDAPAAANADESPAKKKSARNPAPRSVVPAAEIDESQTEINIEKEGQ